MYKLKTEIDKLREKCNKFEVANKESERMPKSSVTKNAKICKKPLDETFSVHSYKAKQQSGLFQKHS